MQRVIKSGVFWSVDKTSFEALFKISKCSSTIST